MAELIPAHGVHHFRLAVSHVDRAVAFYTEVLGFKKLMDLNPGAFLSNGQVGLGIGPYHAPDRAIRGDRFDENRIGLDHLSFGVGSRTTSSTPSESSTSEGHPTPRSGTRTGLRHLHPDLPDPDNIQLELTAPHAA